MTHTLNHSTNLITLYFNDEQNSLLFVWTPTHFSDLTNDFFTDPPVNPMETG